MEKIIFFGTSEFAVSALRSLAKHFIISLIITKPAKPAGRNQALKPSAIEIEAKKLKLATISPEKLDDKIIKKIKDINPLFFVIVDYGKIIPQEILSVPHKGAVNIHPSKLPKYRGASPLQVAILNGEKETAFSIMLIDGKVDHGPILAQKKAEILPDDTYGSLYKRLSELYPEFLTETLKKYLAGEIKPVPQDDSRATFTKMLSREDGKIDWSESAEVIERVVRAYNPWPGTYMESAEYPTPYSSSHSSSESGTRLSSSLKRIKILKASVSENDHTDKNPGDLFKTFDKKLAAKCGRGVLILEQVQPEGKKSMTGEEFVRGYLKN